MTACVAAAFVCTAAATARAQESARFGLDSTIAADLFRGENTVVEPNIVVDVTALARVADGWTVYVRPWFRQPRLPGMMNSENWDKEIYQAAVQYERAGRVSTRVDAGYIGSPIGLGMTDTRAAVNPVIAPHLSYLQPMPAFEPGAPRVSAIAATYPLGGQVTLSTSKWDARAAIVNSAPMRAYVINRESNPASTPAVVAGAGITPMMGLHFGASFATGVYARGEEFTVPQPGDREFRMVNLEGEYAFGYTTVSGEITHNRVETALGHEMARAWFVQASHALTPRWFVAARQEGVSAPPLRTAQAVGPRRLFSTAEATLGYRLTTEITCRTSFMNRKAYIRDEWDQQVGFSVVWARRWW